jgi:DNA-binding NarL/FixJ family response regulator
MTKILLIDDHQVLLDSLGYLLKSIDGIELIGVLNDSRNVYQFLEEQPVDILITDLHMPYLSGIDLTIKLRKTHPNLKILLLTMADDAKHIREAIQAGVHGYILKKTGKEEIEKAISKLILGYKYYSEAVIDELAATAGEDLNDARPETIEHLTLREIEILRLITQEKSTLEISEKLFISIPTVETHRSNLMKKLNVKNVIGMVKYAIKHGLDH